MHDRPASEVAQENVKEALGQLGATRWQQFPHPTLPQVSGCGYDSESPLFVGREEAVERLLAIQHNLPTVIADVERKDRWRMLTLNLASMLLVKEAEGIARCNVCGLVNAHLPTCHLHPFLVSIKNLAREEASELRL